MEGNGVGAPPPLKLSPPPRAAAAAAAAAASTEGGGGGELKGAAAGSTDAHGGVVATAAVAAAATAVVPGEPLVMFHYTWLSHVNAAVGRYLVLLTWPNDACSRSDTDASDAGDGAAAGSAAGGGAGAGEKHTLAPSNCVCDDVLACVRRWNGYIDRLLDGCCTSIWLRVQITKPKMLYVHLMCAGLVFAPLT